MRFRARNDEAVSFSDADRELQIVLTDLHESKRYSDWILARLAPSIHGSILEIGAGHGTYSHALSRMGTMLTCIEPSGAAFQLLTATIEPLPHAVSVLGTLSEAPSAHYDSAVMINVLEHIQDDRATLQDLHDLLPSLSELAVWVPAFPLLLGDFDRKIGHFRRYRRRQLRSIVQDAGFEVLECRHANLPGFFAWLLIVRCLRSTPTTGRLSSVYDRFVVPATRWVEGYINPPFGQSLVLRARKP